MVEWRDTHFSVNYAVSNTGLVKNKKTGKLLKPTKSKCGYFYVSLTRAHRKKKVHRLVITAFLGESEDRKSINHKNGIKTDNNLENLEWVTPKENSIHSARVLNKNVGEACALSLLSSDEVMNIREMWNNGASLVHISKNYCTKKANIHAIVSGKTWTHLPVLPRGNRRFHGKITIDKIVSIKKDLSSGILYQKEIAEKYGVDPSTVSNIKTNKNNYYSEEALWPNAS